MLIKETQAELIANTPPTPVKPTGITHDLSLPKAERIERARQILDRHAGCCNATATATLSALSARIAHESSRPHNPDFLRGLEVAKLLVYEALEQRK